MGEKKSYLWHFKLTEKVQPEREESMDCISKENSSNALTIINVCYC